MGVPGSDGIGLDGVYWRDLPGLLPVKVAAAFFTKGDDDGVSGFFVEAGRGLRDGGGPGDGQGFGLIQMKDGMKPEKPFGQGGIDDCQPGARGEKDRKFRADYDLWLAG